MKITNKIIQLLLVSICLVVLAACGSSSEVMSDLNSIPIVTEEQNQEEASVPDPVYAHTAPLTGLPLEESPTNRPIAVMINNAPAARPQSGLNGADLVYEVLAEGGVTRLVAIYHSNPEAAQIPKIGPIRSIRPYMIKVGESYHGVLAHAGASNDAYAVLQKQHKENLDEITNAGPYYWRDKSRKAPHNLYSNLENLTKGAAKRGYEIEDLSVPAYTFRSKDDLVEGDSASEITIKFQLNNYLVSYKYDPETQLYERMINGKPHTDLTGEPLTAANLVVLGADHKVLDDVGRLAINLDYGGEAIVFERGKMIRGQWIHKEDDVIRIVKDNSEIPFYPGNTYFHVVPNAPDFDSHITIE